MKKILFGLLAASLLTGGLASCNKKLDIEPADSIDAANALNTSSDVQGALVGAYTGLQSNQNYGGYMQFMSDLLADNGDEAFVGTFVPPQEIQRKTILKDNGFGESIWLRAYNTINRTNNVLASLGKLDTPTKRAVVEGEAKFIRSLLYFDLVRLYGRAWNDGAPQSNPGVPLVLTPTPSFDPVNQARRNTVAEVYAQIIADLITAKKKLPKSNGFFATKYAAHVLLSRIYLQQGRYASAALEADSVISSGQFGLNASYADNFTATSGGLSANTKEDIFAIQYSAQSGLNDLNTFYSATQRGDVEIQDQFTDLFETGDDRLSVYDVANGPPTYILKYDGQYGNIKLMRLDEMYLSRAEGNFRAGTSVGATPLSDVNTVRDRAGLAPLTAVTKEIILNERRLELAFEGFRLGDLKRNQESTVDDNGTVIPWNSPRLVFPIPLREINANPNLTQNPGY